MAKKKKTSTKKKNTRKNSKKEGFDWESNKTLIIASALVILVVVIFLIGSGTKNNEPEDDSENVVVKNDLEINVRNPTISQGRLNVDTYSLPKPGFIVAHLALDNGDKGVIIGRSSLLSGNGGPTTLTIGGSHSGKTIALAVYYDDGDERFVVSRDSMTDYSKVIRLN